LGVLLGLAAGVALGAHLGWPTWGTAVAAVLGATIGIVANKPILVTATALLGASLAVGSGLDLVGVGWSPLDALATEALLLVVVAALGALVQWRSVRHEED
ncbi:MAG TPA: hypothetical protein VFH78_09035, partial [Candidatus Thermoplasmatota archaeon]|nr:hypothetical protein [Candidatus Thermoplasmatota archaeon]